MISAVTKPFHTPFDGSHFDAVVIGAGQAGLSMSHVLTQAGVRHVVLEKQRVGHAWRSERWDSFCLVTPNGQCQLPGHLYGTFQDARHEPPLRARPGAEPRPGVRAVSAGSGATRPFSDGGSRRRSPSGSARQHTRSASPLSSRAG